MLVANSLGTHNANSQGQPQKLRGHPQTTQSSTPKYRLAATELRIYRQKLLRKITMAEYETKEAEKR